MRILLIKKMMIFISAVSLFVSTTVAQMPERIRTLTNHLHGLPYSPEKKSASSAKIDDMKHNNKIPCLIKQNTLGGTGFDFGNKIIPIRGGGFIVCGGTNSMDGDFKVPAQNGQDAFIAKYNNLKQLEWAKTVGGSGDEYFNDIAQTFDGGYISIGWTSSNDGDVSGNHGAIDVWAVKFNTSGNIQWQKCLGGSGYDFGNAGLQTFYGGYAISGFTNSNDGDVSGVHGDFDAWLVQLGPKGNLLSQHCYGGSGFDDFNAIVSSNAGGLILYGDTQSNDGDVSGNHGGQDVWAVKANVFGKIVWEKTIGGSDYDGSSSSIAKTTDGNIVLEGLSSSVDGDINAKDTAVSFLTKLNSSTGNILWSKSYANPGPGERAGFGIFATADGGTVETGSVGAFGLLQSQDAFISKFDADGKEEWYKRLGGSDYDVAFNSGFENKNGSLNIMCLTASTDGDVKNNHGGIDTWLIKLGPCGEVDDNGNGDAVLVSPKAVTFAKSNTVLLSSYPNPVSNSTNISFSIPQSQQVVIHIFDGAGKLIKTIADAQMQAGSHQFTWNIEDENGKLVANGIYYLKFNAGNYAETRKVSVIK